MGNGADILIIEDDKDLVNTVRIVLESKKYNVRAAFNGKEGYTMIEEKIPDLIILDVMMKTDTDGFDLAFKLKNISKYHDIPILMVTSFPQKMAEKGPESFQHIMGEQWPVTKFLEKPIDPDELLSNVEDILKK
jgi:DNA-binding response OmpR family regulator